MRSSGGYDADMARRTCPECGSHLVRWRIKDDGGHTISFIGMLVRPRGLKPLNPLRYLDPTPTAAEQALIDEVTAPFELAPGERVVNWRCAACGRSGEMIERRTRP